MNFYLKMSKYEDLEFLHSIILNLLSFINVQSPNPLRQGGFTIIGCFSPLDEEGWEIDFNLK